MRRWAAVLSLLCTASLAWGARRGPWTLDEVVAYLHEASSGLIDRAPDLGESSARLRFVRSAAPPDRFVPVRVRDPLLDQDAFAFDVAGFLSQQGASTFLDAKRRYYARLPWSDDLQLHIQPYARPTAWETLNHPPIKALDVDTPWTDLFADPPPEQDPSLTSPFFDPAFQESLDRATGTALTHGNALRLLANSDAYTEKLRLIADTRTRLSIAVMYWGCDRSSDTMADALIAKAQAGVEVRLITESIYRELLTRRCIDRLVAGGVDVLSYHNALHLDSLGSVMHWKVWIRDGEEMILGGQNIVDYENNSDGFNLRNRDADVLVRGPAVTDAEAAWTAAWQQQVPDPALAAVRQQIEARAQEQQDAGLRGAAHYAAWLGDPTQRMAGNCRVALQGVNAISQPIGPLVEAYLQASHHQVVLSTPTVRYDHHALTNEGNKRLCIHRLMALLHDRRDPQEARVVLLTNGVGGAIGESSIWLRGESEGAKKAKQWFLHRLTRQYGELLGRRASVANRAVTVPLRENPNVEVWTYFQYIHSKLWLFDGLATMVGSWNLETNSSKPNPEAAIFCLDAGLRDQVQQDFTVALVNSVPEQSASDTN